MSGTNAMHVPGGWAPTGTVVSSPGAKVRIVRPVAGGEGSGQLRARQLDVRKVMATFDRIGPVDHDVRIEVIDDISWSMTGGNDALGLRHEALLVYLEFLARSRRPRRIRRGATARGGTWSFKCRTFDCGGSCLDTDEIVLDPAALPKLRAALLGTTYGGISCLGPALAASVSDTSLLQDVVVIRVVLSDFELFDPPGALEEFAASPADLNVAVVFRSPVPAGLDADRVRIHHIDPDNMSSELVATLLNDAVRDALISRASGAG